MEQKKSAISYTYILRCHDQTLYTGITKDIPKRMSEHYYHKRQGAKYTKSRQVKEIMMVWESNSWSAAATLEHYIKTLSRNQKLALINSPESVNNLSESKLKGNHYQPTLHYNGPIDQIALDD